MGRDTPARLEGDFGHAGGGTADISALHGGRAPRRDCISSFQRSAATKAISRRRPRIAIGRDGNRIQRQTEDARILLSSSGRRLMKHPAVKITPAGRRRRPSVAPLIVSRRRRNKYRRSNYRPSSGERRVIWQRRRVIWRCNKFTTPHQTCRNHLNKPPQRMLGKQQLQE